MRGGKGKRGRGEERVTGKVDRGEERGRALERKRKAGAYGRQLSKPLHECKI